MSSADSIEVIEAARWYCLSAVRHAGYVGADETWVQDSLRQIFPVAATHEWVRSQIDYLEARELLEVDRRPGRSWWLKLRRYGYDVVDYTVPCDPGIARPPRP